MTALSRETENVQNPALGAAILWRFACGYADHQRTGDGVPLHLLFVVLPITFHQATAQFVRTTQKASGLRAFAAKFGESKTSKQDLLLAIHDRMLRLRSLTFEAIRLAFATRLIHLAGDGLIVPLSRTQAVAGMADETKQLMRDAEKLGAWCAQLTIHEVAATLKVRF